MLYNLAYLYFKGFYSVKQSNLLLLQQQYKTSVLSYYYFFHKLIHFIISVILFQEFDLYIVLYI